MVDSSWRRFYINYHYSYQLVLATLFERKVLGDIRNRKEPNRVGLLNLLDPFSDVIKSLNQEFFVIDQMNYYYYIISALILLSSVMS